jgi:glycine cleavage system H lipoate-binding protein
MLKETEIPTLSMAKVRLPRGVYFDATHTWAFLETAGKIRVGIDDFMANIAGPLDVKHLKKPGDHVARGEAISYLENNGKRLQVYSPLSGTIDRMNRGTSRKFSKTTQATFTNNWLLKITPDHWEQDRRFMLMGEQAKAWITKEFARLRDFMAFTNHKYSESLQPVLLQEGGEIENQLLTNLSTEIWIEFQVEFIDAVKVN